MHQSKPRSLWYLAHSPLRQASSTENISLSSHYQSVRCYRRVTTTRKATHTSSFLHAKGHGCAQAIQVHSPTSLSPCVANGSLAHAASLLQERRECIRLIPPVQGKVLTLNSLHGSDLILITLFNLLFTRPGVHFLSSLWIRSAATWTSTIFLLKKALYHCYSEYLDPSAGWTTLREDLKEHPEVKMNTKRLKLLDAMKEKKIGFGTKCYPVPG